MKTIDEIKKDGRLLYQYIAGSNLYHCNEEKSDIDTKGLFIATQEELFGLGFDKQFRDKWDGVINLYDTQISDTRNDNTIYEVGKFLGMLLSSNANVLESLFVPEDMMLVKPHRCLEALFANRDNFITKACFRPFVEYAIEQIRKARGLNKKIVNPITERRDILDFTYTFYNQGSTCIKNWLEYRNLKQEYCGLVNIANMHDVYGVFYDWGNFFKHENITFEDLSRGYYTMDKFSTKDIVKRLREAETTERKTLYGNMLKQSYLGNMVAFIIEQYKLNEPAFIDFEMTDLALENLKEWYEKQVPIGYSGMVGDNSNQLRLSSVKEGEKPICHISYNKDGYTKHCIDYKNYKDWEKFRNPKRYESNLNKNYDSKNMYHSIRLIHMGKEIADGNGIILDRREAGDRDFIMDVRHHKFEYDELMDILKNDEEALNKAIANSTLPEEIDVDLVNDILIDIRKKFYAIS